MMVEKSGITIPYRIEAGILLYLDSPKWQGRSAEAFSEGEKADPVVWPWMLAFEPVNFSIFAILWWCSQNSHLILMSDPKDRVSKDGR
jgi:hypothetical protein